MEILLDTCTFLWWVLGSKLIPERTLAVLRDPANRVLLSAVSTWEIAVKHALGRLPLPASPDELVPRLREQHHLESLPIREPETLHLARLPALHRDPFDRMLVSQAICHGLQIATPDPLVRAYPCRTFWTL
jgi:PIN domain nuclease of toxin-antitoxin system